MTNHYIFRFETLAFFVLLCISSVINANEFIEKVLQKSPGYEAISSGESAKQLMLEGKVHVINEQLLKLVPDKEKTAADYFMLGNMFYENDRKLSLELMIKAEHLAPDEVMIKFELALQYHRLRNHQKALEYYQEYLVSGDSSINNSTHALIADCYLHTGEYDLAVDSWLKSYNNRWAESGIYKAFISIFGQESPISKRSQLIQQIKKGQFEVYGDLIELDHNWLGNGAKEDYLIYDIKQAKQLLSNKQQLYQEVLLLNAILDNSINAEKLLDRLDALKIWGTSERLPQLPALTYHMVKRLTDIELVDTKTLMNAFEKTLLKKLNAGVISDHEFKILSYFYSVEDHQKLKNHDFHGWKQRNSQVSAESYIDQKYKGGEDITADLSAAIVDFPTSNLLNTYQLIIHENSETEDDYYASMVAAVIADVNNHFSSHHSIRKINSFFKSLGKKINHPHFSQ